MKYLSVFLSVIFIFCASSNEVRSGEILFTNDGIYESGHYGVNLSLQELVSVPTYSASEIDNIVLQNKDSNDAEILFRIGLSYLKYAVSDEVEDHNSYANESIIWFKKSLENGNGLAGYILGKMYFEAANYLQAVQWLSKSAKIGNKHANYEMGIVYENGITRFKNLQKASQLYHKAARQGSVDAHLKLSKWYNTGFVVEKDVSKAINHLNKIAAQIDNPVTVAARISSMYININVDKKRIDDKIKWLKIAAIDLSDTKSQYALAKIYQNGTLVDKDIDEAMKWYKMAADFGYVPAMEAIALMYKSGVEIEQNDCESLKWYNEAAEMGSKEAMWHMGHFYYYGVCVDIDYVTANKWFALVGNAGR